MYIKTGQPPAPMLAHAHANIHIYIYRCSGPRQSGPGAACVQAARACSCAGVHAYHICIYMPSVGRLGSDRQRRTPPSGRTSALQGLWGEAGEGDRGRRRGLTEGGQGGERRRRTPPSGRTSASQSLWEGGDGRGHDRGPPFGRTIPPEGMRLGVEGARGQHRVYACGRVHGGRRKAG